MFFGACRLTVGSATAWLDMATLVIEFARLSCSQACRLMAEHIERGVLGRRPLRTGSFRYLIVSAATLHTEAS